MKLLEFINKFKNEQDGSIIVIIALCMTIFMGFAALALDIGSAYSFKSDLQKDLDSVALAAVRNLPADSTLSQSWVDAETTAIDYANENGISNLTSDDIDPVYKNGKIIGVTISEDVEVSYSFAKFLGFNSGNVNTSSTAELLTVSGMTGLLPLAMPKTVMDIILANNLQGTNITLKLGPDVDEVSADELKYGFPAEFDKLNSSGGWRGAINFLNDGRDGSGTGKYQNAMANGGYDKMVNIGDFVEANPGDMPVDVGTKLVVGQEVTVPVIEKNAEGKLVVAGFVTFKVTGLEGNNTNQQKVSILTSSYIKNYIASGETNTNVAKNDYGVKAAKLTN